MFNRFRRVSRLIHQDQKSSGLRGVSKYRHNTYASGYGSKKRDMVLEIGALRCRETPFYCFQIQLDRFCLVNSHKVVGHQGKTYRSIQVLVLKHGSDSDLFQ